MVPDALWRHPELEPIDIKVWCALLLYARDRGECNPTNAGLAETVACSVRTIAYSLSRLEDAGFLVGESKGPHRTIRLRPEGWENAPRPFNADFRGGKSTDNTTVVGVDIKDNRKL